MGIGLRLFFLVLPYLLMTKMLSSYLISLNFNLLSRSFSNCISSIYNPLEEKGFCKMHSNELPGKLNRKHKPIKYTLMFQIIRFNRQKITLIF